MKTDLFVVVFKHLFVENVQAAVLFIQWYSTMLKSEMKEKCNAEVICHLQFDDE